MPPALAVALIADIRRVPAAGAALDPLDIAITAIPAADAAPAPAALLLLLVTIRSLVGIPKFFSLSFSLLLGAFFDPLNIAI